MMSGLAVAPWFGLVVAEAVADDLRSAVDPYCGGAPSVAFGVHLKDGRVVDETVDGGDSDSLLGEDSVPCAEGLIPAGAKPDSLGIPKSAEV